jgi:uroporphyrinogen-III synthase
MSSMVTPDANGVIRPPVLLPRDSSGDAIGAALKHAGFGVIHQAVTRTVPEPGAIGRVASWLAGATAEDWLVVTSKKAVALLAAAGLLTDLRVQVAAVGRATGRALAAAGVEVSLIPSTQSGAGLVADWTCPGARVLLPVSALAAPTVAEGLAALGCGVTRIDLYTTESLDALPTVIAQAWPAFGAVVVTSSSVARALDALLRAAGLQWKTRQHPIAMGAPTARTLDQLGHPASAVASAPTPEAILTAVESVLS